VVFGFLIRAFEKLILALYCLVIRALDSVIGGEEGGF